MNSLDFTKIRWAGENCILITARETRQAIILTRYEIECLNIEFKKKQEDISNEKEI